MNSKKIKYTQRGGIRIKPSDIAKTKQGRKLIRDNANSKLAKLIRNKN